MCGQCSGSNGVELVVDARTKPSTLSEKEHKVQEIKQRRWKLSEKIQIFKQDFDKLKERFPEDGPQFERHVSDWHLSAGILYARKVNQLSNSLNPVEGKRAIFPNNVWDEIFSRLAADYFSSFERVLQTGVHRGEEVDEGARLLIARWSNLMLDFFLDMRELEILSKPANSEKYDSSAVRAQFVLSYLLGKSFPFDVVTTYRHHFDLRARLLEDPKNTRLEDLAQAEFDDAGWELMEFRYLEAQLKQDAASEWWQEFDPLREEFLTIGFPARCRSGFSQIGRLFARYHQLHHSNQVR
ncbi:hypothetical protein PCASD_11483 [Puccinia coronata f. sp. avenae]|uniref:Uncharacterized protein n=1 Tax=Puccinia coronata f. sp. avenae TaxID=200324 RepID=A0A2N5V3B0_9BASI|nr:hypothetical protein PCASD_11483 [Puccinia coronata f. sp. avenae]